MRHFPSISLIGVPTDIGAGDRGASMGPEALRVAGIAEALLARGLDVADRGNLFDTWTVFDMDVFREQIAQYADTSHWNLDCLYECFANDGKTYKHNSYATSEITSSAYAMLDFEGQLFGMDVIGNAGVRYQSVDVEAQTVLVVQNRTAIPGTAGTAPNTLLPPAKN